jgi:hypothetical protein
MIGAVILSEALRAESKDPPKPESVPCSILSGEFGGSLGYGVASLHIRSG